MVPVKLTRDQLPMNINFVLSADLDKSTLILGTSDYIVVLKTAVNNIY